MNKSVAPMRGKKTVGPRWVDLYANGAMPADFDWGTVDWDEVMQHAKDLEDQLNGKKALETVRDLGVYLSMVKEREPFGCFVEWIRKNKTFTPRTAENYMGVAKYWERLQADGVSSPTKAYKRFEEYRREERGELVKKVPSPTVSPKMKNSPAAPSIREFTVEGRKDSIVDSHLSDDEQSDELLFLSEDDVDQEAINMLTIPNYVFGTAARQLSQNSEPMISFFMCQRILQTRLREAEEVKRGDEMEVLKSALYHLDRGISILKNLEESEDEKQTNNESEQ